MKEEVVNLFFFFCICELILYGLMFLKLSLFIDYCKIIFEKSYFEYVICFASLWWDVKCLKVSKMLLKTYLLKFGQI